MSTPSSTVRHMSDSANETTTGGVPSTGVEAVAVYWFRVVVPALRLFVLALAGVLLSLAAVTGNTYVWETTAQLGAWWLLIELMTYVHQHWLD